MRVDVDVVLGRIEAGFLDREPDALGLGASVRPGCGGMVGVASVAVADHLPEDPGSAGLCV